MSTSAIPTTRTAGWLAVVAGATVLVGALSPWRHVSSCIEIYGNHAAKLERFRA
jgi:hypothetical protein